MGSGAVCEMNIGCKTRSWEAREEAGMRVQVRVAEALSQGCGSRAGARSEQRDGAGGTGLEPDVMSEGEGGGRSWSHNRTDSDGNRDASVPSSDEVVG